MRAIRIHTFGEPEVLQLESIPDPQPGPSEVLVAVKAAGVDPIDASIRAGHMQGSAFHRKVLPYTPGYGGAGIIQAVGAGVAAQQVGQRVYITRSNSGTYAELAVCDVQQIHSLPPSLSFAQGAVIGSSYSTAYTALFLKADAQSGETVLVRGATGGVGLAAVQWARAGGLTVIGTGGSEAGRRLVAEQGIAHVLDHTVPDMPDQVRALSAGQGIDIVIEMRAENLAADLALLGKRGRVVIMSPHGTVTVDPTPVVLNDLTVLGMSLSNLRPAEWDRIEAATTAGLYQGILRPIVGQVFPLADASSAQAALAEPGTHGRIVLSW
jgi:NADPH:quinone reductase